MRRDDPMRMTRRPGALRRFLFSRRALRWGAVLVAAAAAVALALWLAERSFASPARKRAVQAWLDGAINADVAVLGDMRMRLNLFRDSGLVLTDVEIEHPNPVFPGKLARIGRLGAWAPPWSAAGILPGSVAFLAENVRIGIEQAASGEWSHDGLMQPLDAAHAEMPFPMPNIRHWDMDIKNGHLDLRRRGYALELDADARVAGRAGREWFHLGANSVPFAFGRADAEERKTGTLDRIGLRLLFGDGVASLPVPVPGQCEALVSGLPVSILPFLATGIPMEDSAGVFNGVIRYDTNGDAAGTVFVDGELRDAPLAVFGLPRNSPLRLSWPIAPKPGAKIRADLRMGPSGFGAFTMTIPLADDGRPEGLNVRGDVAALDEIPGFFLQYPLWPDWLSRTFPLIEWRAGKWRGFGWEGEDIVLSLSRGAAGMNLSGTANLLGGRARLTMAPGQDGVPVTVASESLDGAAVAERLSRQLPAQFRTKIRGSAASASVRGLPDGGGGLSEWEAGIVWSDPVVDVAASGSWWASLARVPEAMAMALPEWGGGDGAELRALAGAKEFALRQLSVVAKKTADGALSVEFRAFGDAVGQAAGLLEYHPDGTIEGEVLVTGESGGLAAVERANPEFARVLRLLANGSTGLRMAFRHDAERGGEFIFPFLRDALTLRESLRSRDAGADAGDGTAGRGTAGRGTAGGGME